MDTNISVATAARPLVYRTRGRSNGPLTRLISAGDLGELLKPFVFLDFFEAKNFSGRGFPPHPHSGIATLTCFLEGNMSYVDSTGKSGSLTSGSVEWMRAGAGVWHGGSAPEGGGMRGYQLWLAMPAALELAPAESFYLESSRVPAVGPARILLGSYGGKSSELPLPAPITYLHVQLRDGENWVYQPAPEHDIAWLAVNKGRLHVAGAVLEHEVAAFAEGNAPIELAAEGDVELVIGSAAKHPHPLVTGYYSVHTSEEALAIGEANIAELGKGPVVAAMRRGG